jgi:type IV secretory pathway TrbD component
MSSEQHLILAYVIGFGLPLAYGVHMWLVARSLRRRGTRDG